MSPGSERLRICKMCTTYGSEWIVRKTLTELGVGARIRLRVPPQESQGVADCDCWLRKVQPPVLNNLPILTDLIPSSCWTLNLLRGSIPAHDESEIWDPIFKMTIHEVVDKSCLSLGEWYRQQMCLSLSIWDVCMHLRNRKILVKNCQCYSKPLLHIFNTC